MSHVRPLQSALFAAALAVAVAAPVLTPLASSSASALATTQRTGCGDAPTGMNIIVSDASVITGTNGADFICAGPSANTIHALGGDDIVYGRGGSDTLLGGDGDDVLLGGRFGDTLDGGAGDDWIKGHGGSDTLFGGEGNDSMFGGRGRDDLSGHAGHDKLDGNFGSDSLAGGPGDDVLRGGVGRDNLVGGDGEDLCFDQRSTKNCEPPVLAFADPTPPTTVPDTTTATNTTTTAAPPTTALAPATTTTVAPATTTTAPTTATTTAPTTTTPPTTTTAAPTTTTAAPTTTTVPATTTTTTPPTTTTVVPVDPNCVPFCGVALGSTDRRDDLLDLSVQEATLGKQMDLVRLYQTDPSATFFPAQHQALADAGRTLVYSWKVSRDNTSSPAWANVAAGAFDDDLVRAAHEINNSGHTIFFALHHEPEDNVGPYGTEADYVAMYRHVYEVMNPIAGDNMIWFINYMGHSFGTFDQVEAMYPGDDIIDWISWNPYNWYECHASAPWKTFSKQAAPFYNWALGAHPDKPLMIGETATNELGTDPLAKANWINDMATALETEFPRIHALMWFHQSTDTNFCERRWDSSQASIDAFTAMAESSYFNPTPLTFE